MKALLIVLTAVCICSCANQNMFQTAKESADSDSTFALLGKEYEHILSPDDKVSISIWNHDDLSIGSAFSIYNTNESFGKWVLIDRDSSCAIPYIGKQKLGGLTIREAEHLVADSLSTYVNNPLVEIRVLNREVSILGEVVRPGNYILEKELNTLVEFIAKAEGTTFYSDIKKVQIIRDDKPYLIDLREFDRFPEKNIYLKSGDIVYVPSKKGKFFDNKAPVLIPIASVLTSIGVVISVVSK